MNASAVAAKLNLKPGMKLRIVGKPADVSLPGVTGTASAKAEAVLRCACVGRARRLHLTAAGHKLISLFSK